MSDIILGMGMDMVACARIKQSLEEFGDSFLNRIFLPQEQQYAQSQKNIHQCLAARFAAKEAVSKALGTGIGAEIGWLDIEICRASNGVPSIALHGKGLQYAQSKNWDRILISLTHIEEYGAATAILIGKLGKS